MALDAGSVYTLLGGKFDAAGFAAFDAANKKSVSASTEAEAKITASQARLTGALGRTAQAQERTALATRTATLASASQQEAIARTESEMARLEKTIHGSGVATKLQAAEMGRLTAQHASLSAAIKDTSDKTTLWSRNSEQAAKNLNAVGSAAKTGAAVGILAAGAALVYSAAKATSFNRELLRLHTQAGATTDEVAHFRGEILKLAGTVPQGPKELSEGLYHIVSAGFRGSEALRLLEASAKGAALGGADLEDSSNALIGTLASQIKGVKSASDAQGQLNAIVGAGNMRFEDLDKAVATGVLPTFAAAGLSLKDFGAALATVTDNSTPANVTATRLRMTIAQMVSPTKAAAVELKSIGLTSTSLANDLRKPNGLLLAVEDLKTHLQASGKTAVEQDQVLSNAFGRGKSSATIITLIGEIDRLRSKYQELGRTNGVERLNKDWNEFQHSEAAAFGELKSGAEAFAVTVGQVALPALDKLAHGAIKDFSEFDRSGGAKKVGEDLAGGFDELGNVVSGLAPDVEAVAKALFDVGKAAGLGNAGEVETLLAAFIAFKGVEFVVPILAAFAGGIIEIGAAASGASSIGGFITAISEAGVALPLLGGAAAVAVGAFVALNSGLFSSESAAEKNAAAMEHDKQSVLDLHDALTKTSEAHIAEERAALNHKKAIEQLADVEKKIADKQLKGPAAQNAKLEARLGVGEAANEQDNAKALIAKEVENLTQVSQKQITVAREGQSLAEEEVKTAEKIIALHPPATAQEEAIQQKHLNDLQAEANKASEKANQLTAEAAVHQESLKRLNAGLGAQATITGANAQGVAALQKALSSSGASQKIVTRYELDDQGTQAKLGDISAKLESIGQKTVVAKVLTTAPSATVAVAALKAVLDGVPSSKVIRILHNAPSAKAAMRALGEAVAAIPPTKSILMQTNAAVAKGEVESVQAAIDNLSGRSVAVDVQTAFTKVESVVRRIAGHASGRRSGESEPAVVGEGNGPEWVIDSMTGRGFKVDTPTLLGLGSSDYVIPTERKYSSQALNLYQMLSRDLGVPGYAKGRPSKKHRQVPNAIDPLSLPLSEIEQKQAKAHDRYTKAASKVLSLEGQVRTSERDVRFASKAGRPKDQAKLKELRSELAKAKSSHDYKVEHRKEQEWARTLKEAKAYQKRIEADTQKVNIAGNEMRLADGRGDEAGYQSAKSRRLAAIGGLRSLLVDAQKHVKIGSSYFRQLQEQIGASELEGQSTEGEEDTGLSGAQQQTLKQIEESISLASLTPGLADDTSAAQQLVSFLEGALAGAEQQHRGPEAIKELADQVANARSNLASLTGGGGSNENADTQAQIEQANQRAEAAQQNAQVAERALSVFAGSGDIGSGGRNAVGSVINNNFSVMHMGTPAVQAQMAQMVVSGIDYQRGRPSPRVRVGPT